MKLSDNELLLQKKLTLLKKKSGTHSPSIQTIRDKLPDIRINVDACFLSNPYATDLFLDRFNNDVLNKNLLRDLLEYYPSQNAALSEYISAALNLPKANIFVGNGAAEVIQACMHRFVNKKIIVTIPTFSSYYEFAKPGVEVVYYCLREEENFQLNTEDYIRFVRKEDPDAIVLINPNNPTGNLINKKDIRRIVEEFSYIDNILLDESFIHFAYEDDSFDYVSSASLVNQYENLIIIKSMSKDFGVAGLRVGYGIMSDQRVEDLLGNGFLWNSNGLAEYFIKLYSEPEFLKEYEPLRKQFIRETQNFYSDMQKIGIGKVFPTQANFLLYKLPEEISSEILNSQLLIRHGIYTRSLNDKIGLEGDYLRIASRGEKENKIIIDALKYVLEEV
jgi:histidinol-phosphate/aromatic aminotransferase/cobyric acid decarboxylase-like protein